MKRRKKLPRVPSSLTRPNFPPVIVSLKDTRKSFAESGLMNDWPAWTCEATFYGIVGIPEWQPTPRFPEQDTTKYAWQRWTEELHVLALTEYDAKATVEHNAAHAGYTLVDFVIYPAGGPKPSREEQFLMDTHYNCTGSTCYANDPAMCWASDEPTVCFGSGDSGLALMGVCDVCGREFIGRPITIPAHYYTALERGE